MIKGMMIKLYPTRVQEEMFRKSAGCARFAYNWGLALIKDEYANGVKLTAMDTRSRLTEAKDSGLYEWIKKVSADAWRNSFQDLNVAFKRFIGNLEKGMPFQEAGYPNFKKKWVSETSFLHDIRKLKVKGNRVYLEKIGWVKM